MKLYNIPNAEMFLRKVMTCTGSAHFIKADGNASDLKAMAQSLIQSGIAGRIGSIDEINLSLENHADAIMLMNYAAEMNRSGRAA